MKSLIILYIYMNISASFELFRAHSWEAGSPCGQAALLRGPLLRIGRREHHGTESDVMFKHCLRLIARLAHRAPKPDLMSSDLLLPGCCTTARIVT